MAVTDKQTILVVDHLREDALELAEILQPEWDVKVALNGPDALQKAVTEPIPDMVLLDVNMPGMDGHEVCIRLRELPETRRIPVMFITSSNSEKDEAYGLGLGAVDYVSKPICAPIVKARIRNHIALRKANTELALKNRELELLVSRDKLTNLFNRRKLDECFEHEVNRAERFERPLSVILMDIDHFKRVNDTYGHAVGDAVLVETALRLQASLRNSDIPGRWGGEEFLVICPETELDTAIQLAERLRSHYATKHFPSAGTQTASFGVATHRPGRRPNDMFLRADEALYRAKHKGCNRVEPEEQEM